MQQSQFLFVFLFVCLFFGLFVCLCICWIYIYIYIWQSFFVNSMKTYLMALLVIDKQHLTTLRWNTKYFVKKTMVSYICIYIQGGSEFLRIGIYIYINIYVLCFLMFFNTWHLSRMDLLHSIVFYIQPRDLKFTWTTLDQWEFIIG